MKSPRNSIIALAALLVPLTFTTAALAQERFDVAILGGINTLNKTDPALPDNLLGVPAVLNLAFPLSDHVAIEGDLTWLIPVKQSVELETGAEVDRKPPDVLAYQAGLRVRPPSTTWSPYVAAGAGAMTFTSNTDPDRLPALDKSETMFALSFGGGAQFGLSGPWGVRADFREFVAFPGKDSQGFSDTNDKSDPIWMERGTVGLAYRF